MRPVYITQAGTGASTPLPVNWRQDPVNIGIGCVITSGTATYNVEHTFDDITVGAPTNWFPNINISGATTNKDANYAFPIRAVRLNVTAGTGTVVMAVLQGLGTG